jgi:hypothetical protein
MEMLIQMGFGLSKDLEWYCCALPPNDMRDVTAACLAAMRVDYPRATVKKLMRESDLRSPARQRHIHSTSHRSCSAITNLR